MSIIKDTFFGGAEKKAAKAQTKALEKGQEFTREATEQARSDINNLFPQAQLAGQQGFQAALDVFGQSLPAQANTFQQGNVGAQQAILSGLPQIQNALFGNQVDFSQMQPFQLEQPNFDFFQQELPQVAQRRIDEENAALAALQQANDTAAGMGTNFGGGMTNNIFGGNTNAGRALGGNTNFFNQELTKRLF